MNRKALISLETKNNPALGEVSKFLKIDGTLYIRCTNLNHWIIILKLLSFYLTVHMECNVLVSYKVGDKKQLLLDSFRSPPDITVSRTSKFHLEIASTRVQNRKWNKPRTATEMDGTLHTDL